MVVCYGGYPVKQIQEVALATITERIKVTGASLVVFVALNEVLRQFWEEEQKRADKELMEAGFGYTYCHPLDTTKFSSRGRLANGKLVYDVDMELTIEDPLAEETTELRKKIYGALGIKFEKLRRKPQPTS